MRFLRAKLLVIGLMSSASLAFAACSDSFHLDPVPRPTEVSGAGGSSSSSVGIGGSGGGGVPSACKSSSDCPAPTAVCDTIKATCVECLEVSDCAFRPGTLCSEGDCVCPKAVDSFCEAVPGLNARCVNLVSSSSDCGSCNHPCFGACNNGKCADPWEPTATANAPSPRRQHTAVWNGARMIVWGGFDGSYLATGGMYDPAARTWQATSTVNAPGGRAMAQAVWTSTKMLVWGGFNGGPVNTGGVFDPMTNTWQPITTKDAPSPRYGHTAVWTGQKMLVWGGTDGGTNLMTGGQYDPAMNVWTPITVNSAPTGRQRHSAVWTGTHMIVYGGFGFDGVTDNIHIGGGGEYEPGGDSWVPLQTIGQPSVRADHTAVWTGMEMLVWGGEVSGGIYTSDGAKYSVQQTAWTPMNGPFPTARFHHTALWMGGKMLIWGGQGASGYLNDGGLFNPATNSWDAKEMPTALSARSYHTAIDIGGKMLIWGGDTPGGVTNTGGIFDPAFTP